MAPQTFAFIILSLSGRIEDLDEDVSAASTAGDLNKQQPII